MDKGKRIVFISDHVELITDETVGLFKACYCVVCFRGQFGKMLFFCFMAVYTDTNSSLFKQAASTIKNMKSTKQSYFH